MVQLLPFGWWLSSTKKLLSAWQWCQKRSWTTNVQRRPALEWVVSMFRFLRDWRADKDRFWHIYRFCFYFLISLSTLFERERQLPGCDNGTEIDQQECFAGACLKRASPGQGDTNCDVIKEDTLLQLQMMMIENCAPYQWTQWSKCSNKCSGRRARTALSHETETIQYEWCHKLNNCQTMDCNGFYHLHFYLCVISN